ncbi:uncharacterized protein L201_008084 [Kwoniella dendrophila CBS 6074]|uniref:Meiotically up-regulated protein Msb1/Mug8 domain-containing protein n=1 Tax=Kwoniella dendrophila CBS 6074 TaxID=1295534 RepID=A0AAX4K8E4_9TREE
MPSIFSRSASTPKKSKLPPTPPVSNPFTPDQRRVASTSGGQSQGYGIGEFGTVPNGGSSRTLPNRPTQPLTPPQSPPDDSPPLLPPKFTFLPTHIAPHTTSSKSVDSFSYHSDEVTGLRQYGFLGGIGSKVTIGLSQAGKLLESVSAELIERGLTTPMLFSNQALELSQPRTKVLIQAYLDTLTSNSRSKQDSFRQDIKFAKEQELAWLLRWALSRITRIREGVREICHGVLEWDAYEEFRGRERAAGYPTDAFPFLAHILTYEVYNLIITPLFHLLSKFAAHSHLSGLTPHALSSLFAPLLFNVPTSCSAMAAHATYVRAASATEHLLLAYIRSTSANSSLGLADLPFRLKEWVTGYPAMVASDGDLARGGPRKGARVVRCERATRTVRAYSKDLISQAELWAEDLPFEDKWAAWERLTWKARRGDISGPKVSTAYRRRMMVKENLPLPTFSTSEGRPISYGSAPKPSLETGFGVGGPVERSKKGRIPEDENEDGRFSSLAGKEWSMFEEGGFDAPLLATTSGGKSDIKNRLQFDLTESAKMSISERRRTMDWTEFASPSGGFYRTEEALDVSLSFAAPIEKEITDWPKERDELRKRLHKSQKDSIPFNYDTKPCIGPNALQDSNARTDNLGRVYIEEAFVDCWADFIIGTNWMDREELTFREVNWALIEYKAKPSRIDPRVQDNDPLGDPRKTELYFLFEEWVPPEYQQALLTPAQKKSAFTLFSPKNKKRNQIVPSESVKTRIGQGWGEEDFDKMLLHREQTRKISLSNASDQPHASVWHMTPDTSIPTSPERPIQRTRSGGRDEKRHLPMTDLNTDSKNAGFFFGSAKKSVVRRVKSNDSKEAKDRFSRKEKKNQKEQDIDFELHSASGISSSEPSPKDKDGQNSTSAGKKKDDDKWMDNLVANGARRMDRQDALPPIPTKQGEPMGLPVSPRPPTTQPSILHDQHTPPQEKVSSDEELTPKPIERQHSLRRKAVPFDDEHLGEQSQSIPSVSQALTYSNLQAHQNNQRFENIDDGTGRPKLLAPIPIRERDTRHDTIHGIVDQYNRDSIRSDTDPEQEPYDGLEPPITVAKEKGYFDQDHQAELPPAQDRLSVDSRFDDVPTEEDSFGTELEPPQLDKGLIFDLTPGREPSPARYKHGEPLQFVGEEPEEEEDYHFQYRPSRLN